MLYSVCCHCARISACIVSAALFFRLCSPLPSVALWHKYIVSAALYIRLCTLRPSVALWLTNRQWLMECGEVAVDLSDEWMDVDEKGIPVAVNSFKYKFTAHKISKAEKRKKK